jgi:hypothetical protein
VLVQNIINAIWFALDLGILYTYFKYGRKYFPRNAPAGAFAGWSIIGIITALGIEYAFIKEFGVAAGAGYSAFLQNLLMSILFIDMFIRRGSDQGQSLYLAINKWLGTLAPTVLYGFLGEGGFPSGSFLILVLGILCSVFDLIYIWLLSKFAMVRIRNAVEAAN